jgi:hypothetical protein
MTTTVAPDLKPDHTESEERSTVHRDPAHTTREELDSHPFDLVGVGADLPSLGAAWLRRFAGRSPGMRGKESRPGPHRAGVRDRRCIRTDGRTRLRGAANRVVAIAWMRSRAEVAMSLAVACYSDDARAQLLRLEPARESRVRFRQSLVNSGALRISVTFSRS